jgi:hypothetical protein
MLLVEVVPRSQQTKGVHCLLRIHHNKRVHHNKNAAFLFQSALFSAWPSEKPMPLPSEELMPLPSEKPKPLPNEELTSLPVELLPVTESLIKDMRSLIARHAGETRRSMDTATMERLFPKGEQQVIVTLEGTKATFHRFLAVERHAGTGKDAAPCPLFINIVYAKRSDRAFPYSYGHARVRLYILHRSSMLPHFLNSATHAHIHTTHTHTHTHRHTQTHTQTHIHTHTHTQTHAHIYICTQMHCRFQI